MPRKQPRKQPVTEIKEDPFVYEDPCDFYLDSSKKPGEARGSCRRCGQNAAVGCLTDDPRELAKTGNELERQIRAGCYTDQAWRDLYGTKRNR